MAVRNISSWGQLLGFEDRLNGESGSNRRVHVRHGCDQLAHCRSADGKTEVLASVVNVSRGGIGLLVDKQFERGAVLTVELPLATDRPTFRMLACVLHAAERPNGYWMLGCAFVTELDAVDLQSIGIERPEAATEEQCSSDRLSCQFDASYRPIGVRVAKLGTVTDIANVGVSMLTSEPIELGSIIRLDMRSPEKGTELKTLACIVRVGPRGDHQWMWGCNFIRQISKRELGELLKIPDDTKPAEKAKTEAAEASPTADATAATAATTETPPPTEGPAELAAAAAGDNMTEEDQTPTAFDLALAPGVPSELVSTDPDLFIPQEGGATTEATTTTAAATAPVEELTPAGTAH